MSRLLIPNTCQVPNVLLDEVIPRLPPSAVRVLLAIVRLTYGFQKSSDEISLTQLQRVTGSSRQGVVNGVRDLGDLVHVAPGAKGRGSNKYSLNLDMKTGQLVNKIDQSINLTSQNSGEKVVNKVDLSKPSNPKPNSVAKGKPSPSDPRVKEFFAWWADAYQKRFGAPYVFSGAKEGKLIKNLPPAFDFEKLKTLAADFFDSRDVWVRQKGGFTIGVFVSRINKFNSCAAAKRANEGFVG